VNEGSGDRDGRPASGARPGRRTARLRWLLGGGGVAIAAAGVAIGVFAVDTPASGPTIVVPTVVSPTGGPETVVATAVSPTSEPEIVVPTTIPPTSEAEVETPAAVSPTTGPTGSGGAEEDPLVPADAHIIGDPDAPVTMVVFSSFTCPACAMFALGTEQEIIANYVRSGKVRIVYRVVAVGPESELAAEAVECAGDQGGFVDYYRALFENWVSEDPVVFSRENLRGFAVEVGLDGDAFLACLDGREYALHVRREFEAAGSLGIEYTPTVFINREGTAGLAGYDFYSEAIERELARAN